MPEKPIAKALPADLPEDWKLNQIVSPNGAEAGLDSKHGYNYQSAQINAAQRGVNALNEAVANKADLDPVTHQIVEAQIPGGLADEAVTAHNESADPHANMNYVVFREGAPVPPVPVNADLLEGKTKAEVSAEILAAMDASLASDKVKWDAKADLVAPVTVTVPLAGWTGAGPWVQTVSVAGVTEADNGLGVYPVDVADDAARKLYEKAYGCLAAEAETVAGGVVLTCRSAKPEVAFQVVVKGVR